MQIFTMLLTKRHALFLSVNAVLIFVNMHLWSFDPKKDKKTVSRNHFPSDDYDYYNNGHMIHLARSPSNETDEKMFAPKPMGYAYEHGPKTSDSNIVVSKIGNTDIRKQWRKKFHNYNISHPDTDAYVTPVNMKEIEQRDFNRLRRKYKVPSISHTNLVNCAKVIAGDLLELQKAQQVMLTRTKVPIYEETYLEWFKDCTNYRHMRGYVEVPLTKEEEEFPLAFGIAMYSEVEATERLLRSIYRPNNFYCIHVDTKSSLLIHQTMRAMASCFDNVWIASHLDKIKWGDVSVLLPEINCMRDLVKYYGKGKWKYFINLTGQELPLRTNYEIVRIAKIFNGSNDIAGSRHRMDMDRVKYKWTHRWSKTYQQTIFYNTFMPKDPVPYNLTFYKGELHGLFSRKMVEYIVENPIAKRYLEWVWNTGHPSEHYWNVLNYNKHVQAPGGYIGSLELAEEYSVHPVIRVKNWLGLYGNRTCHGKVVRGICVFGVEDVPWLSNRPELFINKFHLTYQYLGYDCLEELHRNRTKLKNFVPFNEEFYKKLPVVLYSKKDGL